MVIFWPNCAGFSKKTLLFVNRTLYSLEWALLSVENPLFCQKSLTRRNSRNAHGHSRTQWRKSSLKSHRFSCKKSHIFHQKSPASNHAQKRMCKNLDVTAMLVKRALSSVKKALYSAKSSLHAVICGMCSVILESCHTWWMRYVTEWRSHVSRNEWVMSHNEWVMSHMMNALCHIMKESCLT